MSPRYVAVLIAAIAAIGGTVALAKPAALRLQAPIQAPTMMAQTQTESMPKRAGRGWLKELNLTPDQIQKIRAIRSQYKDSLAQKRQAVQQAQQTFRESMAGDASQEQLRQQYSQLKALRQDLADTQFASTLAIREVLNPEQRGKFLEHMQKQQGQRRDRLQERQEKS